LTACNGFGVVLSVTVTVKSYCCASAGVPLTVMEFGSEEEDPMPDGTLPSREKLYGDVPPEAVQVEEK
jgi:hypothetical protein